MPRVGYPVKTFTRVWQVASRGSQSYSYQYGILLSASCVLAGCYTSYTPVQSACG
jgi:hypothetical protein